MTAGRNEKNSFHTDFVLRFLIAVGFKIFFCLLFGVFSGALFVSFFFALSYPPSPPHTFDLILIFFFCGTLEETARLLA